MRSIVILPLAAVGALLFTGPLAAKQQTASTSGTVVAVNVKHANSGSGGSAILLSLDSSGSELIGWFATCFHVVHDAQSFTLDFVEGVTRKTIATSENAQLHVRNLADVVIIRAPVQAQFAKQLHPLFTAGAQQAQEGDGVFEWSHDKGSVEGTAYGFSFLDRKTEVAVAVKIWGHERFDTLPAINGQAIVTDTEKPDPNRVGPYATFLGNEITMPGMSGGLVVTAGEERRFAGMIFARIAGVQGMAVAANTVVGTWREAEELMAASKLATFDQNLVTMKLPFNADLQVAGWREYEESRVEWESFDQWSLAFRNDSDQVATFERFQELRLDLQAVDLAATEVFVKGEGHSDADRYDFVLNGRVVDPEKPLKLHPGENLLVISKHRSRGSLEINDFFLGRNKLSAWISTQQRGEMEAKPRLHISRSLPSLIKAYSVYVTIVADALKEPKHQWPEHIEARTEGPFRSWDQFGGIPENIQHLVAHAVLDWRFRETDLRTGSAIAGSLAAGDLTRTGLRRVSSQTFDLRIPLEATINSLLIRHFGLKVAFGSQLGAKETKEPVRIWLTVRFQLCANADGKPTVSVRALSATADEATPLTIPLIQGEGSSLAIDVSALLSHVTVAYLNLFIFKPSTEDRSTEEGVLIALGGVSDNEWHRLVSALLGFVKDDKIRGSSLRIMKLSVQVNESFDWSAKLVADITIGSATLPKGTRIEGAELRIVGEKYLKPQNDEVITIGVETMRDGMKVTLKDGTNWTPKSGGFVIGLDNELRAELKANSEDRLKKLLDAAIGRNNGK